MTLCEVQPQSRTIWPSRRRNASIRVTLARQQLAHCQLCAHRCGVDRLAGEQGLCHAGPKARVFSMQTEVSDELELIPVFAIALSGCDLRCDFCITGTESWNARAGSPLSAASAARAAEGALQQGARSIMILGGEPTVHLPSALEIVSHLPEEAKLVWKTNAHGSAEARALLEGMFDVWLADFKFGNDACAMRLAHVPAYLDVVTANLRWARERSELIVRHLLMPGHIDCCWAPVASWLAREMPEAKVNVRSGFWPAWKAERHTELRARISPTEEERAFAIARSYSLRLIQ